MITMDQYWMGRDKLYPSDFTDIIQANGHNTVFRVNALLQLFSEATGIPMETVASGWRPLAVNQDVANAAEHSHHIDAQACDIRDTSNRDLARWVAANQDKLSMLALWCERFEWTPTWVHFQILPPPSGRRFFIPSMAPAIVARLDEQSQFNC